MTTAEPLPPLTLPGAAPGDDWLGWLTSRVQSGMEGAAAGAAALKAGPAGAAATLEMWNDIQVSLANVFAVSSVMSSVHPQTEVIDAAEKAEVEARKFVTDLHLDPEIYAQLEAFSATSEGAALDPGARRVLEDALRDFRRSGVDRDEETREKLRQLEQRADELGQSFSRNIRDGRQVTLVPAQALAALPEDYRADHQPNAEGMVEISTDYPDTVPFMTFSADASARHQVSTTFNNIAWPDNDEVLAELLSVRHELAITLGYPDWPTYDAEVKMIGAGSAIMPFVDGIAAAAEQAADRDYELLLARARRDGLDALTVGDRAFYEEAVRREQLAVDAQVVRQYFDFEKVRRGLLEVTGRLFGITYEPVDAATWHAEVASFDVYRDGQRFGRIHLDLHPRERKYNHAAQFDLVSGVAGRQLPEGVLVCNFSRGLMEHDDVVTLFHEFGHLLHHIFAGAHEWVRFSGVATEWDFVEAPSQMLEEWAWDAQVLQTFATDAEGAPIPTELVEAMRAAEEFGKGIQARTQMVYAAISYLFHAERPHDLTARMQELYSRYGKFSPLPDTHFHCGFGHLEGYGSGYYTYMWSLVIAKDLFTAFDADDLFATDVAQRYRDRVLTSGGSKPAADLVTDFLGRPFNDEAFSAWLNH